jgi:hypothetical protein
MCLHEPRKHSIAHCALQAAIDGLTFDAVKLRVSQAQGRWIVSVLLVALPPCSWWLRIFNSLDCRWLLYMLDAGALVLTNTRRNIGHCTLPAAVGVLHLTTDVRARRRRHEADCPGIVCLLWNSRPWCFLGVRLLAATVCCLAYLLPLALLCLCSAYTHHTTTRRNCRRASSILRLLDCSCCLTSCVGGEESLSGCVESSFGHST